MQSPASSTICGTHGAKKNVKSCLEECAGISGKNGKEKKLYILYLDLEIVKKAIYNRTSTFRLN